MLNKLFTKIVGSRNERLVRKMGKAVERINALEESVQALSAEQLMAKTAELRQRHAGGESLDACCPKLSRWCARPPSAPSACATTTCS
jgi:preprotein translocase subunit SecA